MTYEVNARSDPRSALTLLLTDATSPAGANISLPAPREMVDLYIEDFVSIIRKTYSSGAAGGGKGPLSKFMAAWFYAALATLGSPDVQIQLAGDDELQPRSKDSSQFSIGLHDGFLSTLPKSVQSSYNRRYYNGRVIPWQERVPFDLVQRLRDQCKPGEGIQVDGDEHSKDSIGYDVYASLIREKLAKQPKEPQHGHNGARPPQKVNAIPVNTTIKCQHCGRKGHTIEACYQRRKSGQPVPTEPDKSASYNRPPQQQNHRPKPHGKPQPPAGDVKRVKFSEERAKDAKKRS